MPLYVDLHYIHSDNFSEEDAFRAHLADLNVQDKFGVTHKKFWINFDQKTMFCLVEGPDKEACNAAHQMAHMDHACNIIEVSDEEFVSFLGIGKKNQHDMALTLNGEIDSGYRTILLVRVSSLFKQESYKGMVYRFVERFDGKVVPQTKNQVMASFIYSSKAIACAKAIREQFNMAPKGLDFTMALVTGKPVDDYGTDLFQEAKKKVETLCKLGQSGAVYMDSDTKNLSHQESNSAKIDECGFKIIGSEEIRLFESLLQIFDMRIKHTNFKAGNLGSNMGLSKAQTYRKIKALTGMSPNEFIREMRLRRSLEALKQNGKTVAEIAYETGFNSPTYFTRVFKERFGALPSEFARLNAS